MIPVKIQCGCGQRYTFDVEPINGRMPSAVACPVCGADGTSAANEAISQSLAAQPAVAPAPGVRPHFAPTAPSVPPSPVTSAPSPRSPLPRGSQGSEAGGEGEKWKWWYFVLAGVCIAGYSIWQAYNQHRIKPLGELFLAVMCIAIGIWDFKRKSKKQT